MLCRTEPVLIVLALAFVADGAQAQPVYRCGPSGNQYSQQPCPEGRIVDVSDPRSPAQAAEARAAVREQHRLAAEMARERRAEERAHPPAGAGGIRDSRADAAAKLRTPEKRPQKKASSRKSGAVHSAALDDPNDLAATASSRGKKRTKLQD